MIKCIAFDFDGTLVDSRNIFLSAYNQIATRYGFIPITDQNKDELLHLSLKERLKRLKVPVYLLPILGPKFLSLYKLQVTSLPFVDGMKELLAGLRERNVQLAIISSNSRAIIYEFLSNNTATAIPLIYSSSKLFGKHRVLKRFRKEQKLQHEELLYVCDERRDIDACKKACIKPVWVEWGFETQKAIGNLHDGFMIKLPGDLLRLLDELNS